MREHNERWVLDHLIGLCRDEARVMRFASDHVSDPRVRALMNALADERRRFAEELLPHAQRAGGGGPQADGSWAGSLHRRWLEMRDQWLGLSDRDLLATAARDERRTLALFEEALAGLLPPSTRDVVEAQYAGIQRGRDRVRALLAL